MFTPYMILVYIHGRSLSIYAKLTNFIHTLKSRALSQDTSTSSKIIRFWSRVQDNTIPNILKLILPYTTLSRHYQISNTQIDVSFDDGIYITKKALTYFGNFYSIFNVFY